MYSRGRRPVIYLSGLDTIVLDARAYRVKQSTPSAGRVGQLRCQHWAEEGDVKAVGWMHVVFMYVPVYVRTTTLVQFPCSYLNGMHMVLRQR